MEASGFEVRRGSQNRAVRQTAAKRCGRVGADILQPLWYGSADVRTASELLEAKRMTQKHVQVSAYAVLLILGVSTAWAEAKKEGHREQLPAPKACCPTTGA